MEDSFKELDLIDSKMYTFRTFQFMLYARMLIFTSKYIFDYNNFAYIGKRVLQAATYTNI